MSSNVQPESLMPLDGCSQITALDQKCDGGRKSFEQWITSMFRARMFDISSVLHS